MTGTGPVRHRTLVLQPGQAVAVNPAQWADTLVIVISGELELLCRSGRRARFASGAVLTLAGLPVRSLSNPRLEPLTLCTVSRCEPDR